MTHHPRSQPTAPATAPGSPPKRRGRFTRFVAISLVLLLMPIFLVATAIAATGTVTVRIQERSPAGMNLIIPVPALLFDVAAFVAPRLIPDDALAEIRDELAPWQPALAEAANALNDCPTGVLVDVRNRDEHVVVRKMRGRYRVNVDSADLDLQVSVPSRIMRRALQAVDLL